MGDTDGWLEPGKPLLPFGVLHPPTLPDKIRFQDVAGEVDLDWREHAKYFGAREDHYREGFETRPLNKDPAGNVRPRFPGDWEVEYRLGSPSDGVRWDDVIAKWGLPVLNKAGFLNLDLGPPAALLGPQGRYFHQRPELWKDEALHPVFRRDMWKAGLSDQQWSAIRPAFLLASALLDDPATMCFFHAVATRSCHVLVQDPLLKQCTKLQVPDTLTEAEQASIFQKICNMRQWTYFYWEKPAELGKYGAYAYTIPTGVIAAGLRTSQTQIGFGHIYCQLLMAWQQKGSAKHYSSFFKSVPVTCGIPASHVPEGFENDLDSPAMRTYVLFANIVVHEFAHAFRNAYYQPADPNGAREPFVGDDRSSEIGYAVSRHILGGIPYASSFMAPAGSPPGWRQHVEAYAPFGIYFQEKWLPWNEPGRDALGYKRHLAEGKDADFTTPILRYPVAQRQVDNYFTKEMWETRVPRYGLEALKFVKIPEWAVSRMPGPDPARPEINPTLR